MSRPQTFEESQKEKLFAPDHLLLVSVATTQYDGVYGIPNGYFGPSYVVPLLESCPNAQEDNAMLCCALAKYGITDQGPQN